MQIILTEDVAVVEGVVGEECSGCSLSRVVARLRRRWPGSLMTLGLFSEPIPTKISLGLQRKVAAVVEAQGLSNVQERKCNHQGRSRVCLDGQ